MSSCHSLLLALAFASCCVPGLRADECREESVHYNGYVVQRVEIRTPISFFAAATFGFDQLKSRLPLQETQQFSVKKLSEGNSLIFSQTSIGLTSATPSNNELPRFSVRPRQVLKAAPKDAS